MLALAAALHCGRAQAQCTKDIDCKANRVCEAGKCTEPAPLAGADASEPAKAPWAGTPAAPDEPAPPRVLAPPRVIAIESPPLQAPPRFERRTGLMVGGIIATSVGIIALGVGVVSSGSSTCHRELGDNFGVDHCQSSPNYVAWVVGGVLVAAGVPMIIVGAKKVRVRSEACVSPWLSAQGGGLALRLTL